MKEYNICGEKVVISDGRENYCYLIQQFREILSTTKKTFSEWYDEQNGFDSMMRQVEPYMFSILDSVVDRGMGILNENGIYSVSETFFKNNYCAGYFDEPMKLLGSMKNNAMVIEKREEDERNYRSARLESRTKFHATGKMGIGKVLKSVGAAGVNMTTGLTHSVVNAVGNAESARAAQKEKSSMYESAKERLLDSLGDAAWIILEGTAKVLESEANMTCEFSLNEDIEKRKAIIDSYAKGRIPEQSLKEQLIRALMLDPFNDDPYICLWKEYGDQNGELRELAFQFGMDLEQYIEQEAENFAEELFEKNCGGILEAFDMLGEAASYEKQLERTLDELLVYCAERNIPEDAVSHISICRDVLEAVDLNKRTVHGVVYATREMADNVEKDYETFYTALKGKNVFDPQVCQEVRTKVYRTDVFNNNIEVILNNEQLRRDPVRIHENLMQELQMELEDETLSAGWIDIPGYFGNYSDKKNDIICKVTKLHSNDEEPLVLLNCETNGKSGVLFTNYSLRVYSKGLYSNENQAYPIKCVTGIKCAGNGEYLFDVYGHGTVTISLRGVVREEDDAQIALRNAMWRIVRLIDDIYPEDIKQLHRLLHGSIICQCGTKLLHDEKVCPVCRKMRRENGEFADTQICPNCKRIILAGKKFCSKCGASLVRVEDNNVGV